MFTTCIYVEKKKNTKNARVKRISNCVICFWNLEAQHTSEHLSVDSMMAFVNDS